MFFYVTELLNVIMHERKTAYRHPSYGRPFDVLCCRLEGESCFRIKQDNYVSPEGSVVFIPRNVPYAQEGRGRERIIAIHFMADIPPAETIRVFDPKPEIRVQFEDIYHRYKEQGFAANASLMAKLYQLIDCLFSPSQTASTLAERATAIFEASYYDADFTVGEWASQLGVSRTCLQKLCKQELKQAPCAYLQHRRLSYGAQLLTTTKHTVKSIGLMCGYYSDKNFIAAFSARYGMSPLAYRLKHGVNG